MKLFLKNSVLLVLSLLAFAVFAAPQIELNIVVEKDVTTVNSNGEEVTQRVTAAEVLQGDTLFYTIHYKNSGDETATNVQLDNPIAEGTSYVENSAWGDNSVIQFTLNGKDYQPAEQLTTAQSYTAIRWNVKEIKPGTAGKVGFNTSVN